MASKLVTVYIDEELDAALAARADIENTHKPELIRQYLMAGLTRPASKFLKYESKLTDNELERGRRLACKDDWNDDDSADASCLLLGFWEEIVRLRNITQSIPKTDSYIEVRRQQSGGEYIDHGLDEVVGRNIHVHMERMDDGSFWMAFTKIANGLLERDRTVVWLTAKKKGLLEASVEIEINTIGSGGGGGGEPGPSIVLAAGKPKDSNG